MPLGIDRACAETECGCPVAIRNETDRESAALIAPSRLPYTFAWILLAATFLWAAPAPVGRAMVGTQEEYRLRMYNIHTRESIDVVFRRGDDYITEALNRLNYFLRDHRTGAVEEIDTRLFDLLADLIASVGQPDGTLEVICGYRSPATNAALREHSSGVAEHSLHMEGMAIDIRLPGTRTSVLRDAALSLQRGGVGYYPASDFIHVDVGRVRSW
jgi:uncharacterized protein YcbK (DUF882 family)